MDFHPGGVNELMRGVGKDATKLFENVSATISDYPSDQRYDLSLIDDYFYVPIDHLLQVHAWVNYQSILQKCVVGRLSRGSVSGTTSSPTENPVSSTSNCSSATLNLITSCTSE